MTIKLNHTIVYVTDGKASATFLADLFGLAEPVSWGPFLAVELANEVTLDFYDAEGQDPRSTTPSSSPRMSSTGSSGASASKAWTTGPIRAIASEARSTPTTLAEASTSTIPAGTCWRSSLDPTATNGSPRDP